MSPSEVIKYTNTVVDPPVIIAGISLFQRAHDSLRGSGSWSIGLTEALQASVYSNRKDLYQEDDSDSDI